MSSRCLGSHAADYEESCGDPDENTGLEVYVETSPVTFRSGWFGGSGIRDRVSTGFESNERRVIISEAQLAMVRRLWASRRVSVFVLTVNSG